MRRFENGRSAREIAVVRRALDKISFDRADLMTRYQEGGFIVRDSRLHSPAVVSIFPAFPRFRQVRRTLGPLPARLIPPPAGIYIRVWMLP